MYAIRYLVDRTTAPVFRELAQLVKGGINLNDLVPNDSADLL